MNTQKKQLARQGIALIAAMIFIVVFAAISIGFLSLSSANTQIADDHRAGNSAFNAALSGLDCARYLLVKAHNAYKATSAYTTSKTIANTVLATEANTMWNNLYTQLCAQLTTASNLGGTPSNANNTVTGAGYIIVSGIQYQNSGNSFTIRYSHAAGDTNISIACIGKDGTINRMVGTSVAITKPKLNYGFAGRGRVWLAGNTTIHGDVYSSYGYKSNGSMQSMSPFNMTSDSVVEGTLNTILTKTAIDNAGYYQFETLGADGEPTYAASDQLQGQYESVNYGAPASDFAGMEIGDYDTSSYKSAIPTTTISASAAAGSSLIQSCTLSKSSAATVTEYFPHANGSYTTKASTGSLPLKRYVYDGKTIKNVTVSVGENALFKNCTFEGVLYVNCNTSGPSVSLPSSYTTSAITTFLSTTKNYNNIRFENCTFNGTIISNVPQALNSNWWMGNSLYFTGTAAFQNNSGIQEATILAPHFNVNLGNTNSDNSNNNTLTGAIVGGIVDVRGNANIEGTIISMADTSSYPSGYVSNIGATLLDGGSETVAIGDIGTIEITPNLDGNLPYGIKTPVVLNLNTSAFTANYSEN
jgi:Tfp pilus assembly protein PilX